VLDLNVEGVEVSIREDGKVLWVNTEEGCVLRISNIKSLVIEDLRTDECKQMTLEYLNDLNYST